MAIFCDLIVLLTSVLDFYRSTFILVIYVHVFLVFKKLVKLLDRKSNLFAIFEVLVTQVLIYIKGAIYLSIIIATFILLLAHIVQHGGEIGNDQRNVSTSESVSPLAGYSLAWMFDTHWGELLREFMDSFAYRPASLAVFVTISLFLIQAFFKNVLIRLFLSLVIGSKLLVIKATNVRKPLTISRSTKSWPRTSSPVGFSSTHRAMVSSRPKTSCRSC